MRQATSWEQNLVALAMEAMQPPKLQLPVLTRCQGVLQHAYTYCDQLTAFHSHSFHLASRLLPTEKRQAVRALYAFCRVTDDIVDNNEGVDKLNAWKRKVFSAETPTNDPVIIAWSHARTHFNIPTRYAEQLVEGVARDLTQTRYQTFDDLATYSYGVASTVGLMSMHIIGYNGDDAIPYAVKLGLALQLTNILRDIAEDWQRGRLYLPLDELDAFGLSESTIADGIVTPRWRDFMRFQIERNRQLYTESWAGIQQLNPEGRFAIAAAAGLYRAILEDIEQHDYNVFTRRAHIGKWSKLRRLPNLWLQSRNKNHQ